jgi:hypothetical protein
MLASLGPAIGLDVGAGGKGAVNFCLAFSVLGWREHGACSTLTSEALQQVEVKSHHRNNICISTKPKIFQCMYPINCLAVKAAFQIHIYCSTKPNIIVAHACLYRRLAGVSPRLEANSA